MNQQSFKFVFEAIGTHWVIDVFGAPPGVLRETLLATIKRRTETFDTRFSRFRKGTLVEAMSQRAGAYKIQRSERRLIYLYKELYHITDGYFTPLIGQPLADAGYDDIYSLTEKKIIHPTERWEDVLELSANMLTLKKPALLDFGGAGKGYLVDEVSAIIQKSGAQSHCVDAGGDMYYWSRQNIPINVGLEHPHNNTQIIGTILATCLFFVPAHKLSHFSFQYLILRSDYTVEKSKQLDVKLYYN